MWAALGAKVATGVIIQFDPLCIVVEESTGTLTGTFAGTTPASVTCSAGSSPLPLQTQGLIKWSTAGVVGGRRVQGRTFVPAPDEGDNTASSAPSGSYISQLAAGVTALLTAGSTASKPVIWHRPGGAGAGAGFDITAGVPSAFWASQRGRRD